MQLPKLTPLQSRLLASLAASCLLVVIWITFQPHHFVYAAELGSGIPAVAAAHQYAYDDAIDSPSIPDVQITTNLDLDLDLDLEVEGLEKRGDEGEGPRYEPEFTYFERGIIGRAEDGVNSLANNIKYPLDIKPGTTAYFVFGKEEVNGPKGEKGAGLPSPLFDERTGEEVVGTEPVVGNGSKVEGDEEEEEDDIFRRAKRQNGKQVYISINTCRQPSANGTATNEAPPQLTLYVSTSTRNTKPGPDAKNDLATDPIELDGGFANFTLQTDSDVYVGVSAPAVDNNWDGNWHFEIAASIDNYYHRIHKIAFLYLVDTDSSSALFITPYLTRNASPETNQKWMDMKMPFTMYAFAEKNNGRKGLERSACGLKEQFNKANIKVDAGMTNRTGNLPQAQFHIQGLNASTKYYGYVAMNGNGTTDGLDVPGNAVVGGGGQVWQQFSWSTKSGKSMIFTTPLPIHTSSKKCQNNVYFMMLTIHAFNRRQLPSHIQPLLLHKHLLRRPRQPLPTLPLRPRHPLRQPRPRPLPKLHKLACPNRMQHHRNRAVQSRKKLQRLRPRLQKLALLSPNAQMRGLQRAFNHGLACSAKRECRVPQRHDNHAKRYVDFGIPNL